MANQIGINFILREKKGKSIDEKCLLARGCWFKQDTRVEIDGLDYNIKEIKIHTPSNVYSIDPYKLEVSFEDFKLNRIKTLTYILEK